MLKAVISAQICRCENTEKLVCAINLIYSLIMVEVLRSYIWNIKYILISYIELTKGMTRESKAEVNKKWVIKNREVTVSKVSWKVHYQVLSRTLEILH